MSNIVKAREILYQLRQDPSLSPQHKKLVGKAVSLMHRKFNGRATVQSRQFTPAMAKQIRAYLKASPNAHYQHVATMFGVNIGRVTEAIHG